MKNKRYFYCSILLFFFIIVSNLIPVTTYGAIKTDMFVSTDNSISDRLYDSSDKNIYHFQLEAAGSIVINFINTAGLGSNRWTNSLYWVDNDGNSVYLDSFDAGEKVSTNMNKYRLPAGTYYIEVRKRDYADFSNLDYSLTIKYTKETADSFEQEFNNSITNANIIKTNASYIGNLCKSDDVDYYKFTLGNAGNIVVNFKNIAELGSNRWTNSLYWIDDDGNSVFMDSFDTGERASKNMNKFRLPAGTYYIEVRKRDYADFTNTDYKLTVKYKKETSTSYEQEFNNSLVNANVIKLNKTYTGNLSRSDGHDYYKFTLSQAGSIMVNFTNSAELGNNRWTNSLYWIDKDGNSILLDSFDTGEKASMNMAKFRVPAGSYYVEVRKRDYADFSNLDYKLIVKYSKETAGTHEQEFNNSFASANTLKIGKTYIGNLSNYNDQDYYKFRLSKSKNIAIIFGNCSGLGGNRWTCILYKIDRDGNYNQVCAFDSGENSKVTFKNRLSPGSYYIKIVKRDYADLSNTDYKITIK
jgi:hypothetical protein